MNSVHFVAYPLPGSEEQLTDKSCFYSLLLLLNFRVGQKE